MKRSPLVVIFATIFIDLVGFGIVIPILPYYVGRFDAPPSVVGWLFAVYSLMQFIFAPVLGRLSDRYGRRPVLLVSILGSAVSYFMMGAAGTLALLFAGRILAGITGGNISTAQAYIADVTTQEDRAKGMGLVGAAFGLGFIFGPAIGGVMSGFGAAVPFYFAGVLSLANALLLYFVLPESLTEAVKERIASQRRVSMFEYLRGRRLSLTLAIYFLLIVAFSIMTTSFALFTMTRFGFDETQNGYMFSFIGVIAVVAQVVVVRRFVKEEGEAWFVILGLLLLIAGFVALPFADPDRQGWTGALAVLCVASAVVSVGNQIASPLLTSIASKSVGAEVQGGMLGLVQSLGSLARFAGPLLGSFLIVGGATAGSISDHSLFVTFWTSAGIAVVALLCAFLLRRMHVAVEPERTAVRVRGDELGAVSTEQI